MVVVEERGNPAGLRQAPRERRRRERGRAAPKERRSHVLGSPKPQLYIGERGGCAPFRVSHPQGVRPALDGKGGGGQEGERGEAPTRWALRPIWTRVCPLPLSLAPWTPCGGRTSPPRGWSPPTLGPRNLLGQVAPLGGPPGPSRWSRYNTDIARNFSGDQNRTSHI